MNPFDIATFVTTGGIFGLCLLLFVETGLLIGFIFPGDSLLFTAGVFAAQQDPYVQLWHLWAALPLAAALGDQLGFYIGRRFGPLALRGRIGDMIGPTPVQRTEEFFHRFGSVTVLLARFIAVVRTLVPVMAGFSRMSWWRFTIFSLLGSYLWILTMTALGYFLGTIPFVREHIELLVIGCIAIVLLPMIVTVVTRMRRIRRMPPEERGGAAEHLSASTLKK